MFGIMEKCNKKKKKNKKSDVHNDGHTLLYLNKP